MKNFQKIFEELDVSPLLNAIMRQPDLWNQNKLRQEFPGTPHNEAEDIWVRFNDVSNVSAVLDDCENLNYPAFFKLPQVRSLIFGLMAKVEGERLGSVLITKLAPGKRIYAHKDEGVRSTYYDRYHIVLNSAPGSLFRAGDETVHMRTGELWWFDNTQEHEVINNSAEDRIHLIVDIRTFR